MRTLAGILVLTGCVWAQPTINPGGIVNAADYSQSVARGSMFLVFGSNLGPAPLVQATSFPIPTSLGGTVVRVNSGGVTREAPVVYTSASQVAAILPSDTGEGVATLSISFNGQTSAGVPFLIVRTNFAAFTNNQTGTGQAAIQNYNSPNELVRNGPAQAANPGQTAILWGTGLGPITASDAGQPPVADLNAAGELLVGGRSAPISYKGRSPCCAGIDQINFVVPQGVSGCFVPIAFVPPGTTGTRLVTMAVAASGRACTELGLITASDLDRARLDNGIRLGSTLLVRYNRLDSTERYELALSSFSRARVESMVQATQRILAAPEGQCEVSSLDVGRLSGGVTLDFFREFLYFSAENPLDAGESIRLTGAGQTQLIPRIGGGLYAFDLRRPTPEGEALMPGRFTLDNGSGGRDISAFQAGIDVASGVRFSDTGATIPRNRDLSLTWTGGGQDDRVILYAASIGTSGQTSSTFACSARASSGRITAPASMLSALQVSGSSSNGAMLLISVSPFQRSEPGAGLDAFYGSAMTVAFRPVRFE